MYLIDVSSIVKVLGIFIPSLRQLEKKTDFGNPKKSKKVRLFFNNVKSVIKKPAPVKGTGYGISRITGNWRGRMTIWKGRRLHFRPKNANELRFLKSQFGFKRFGGSSGTRTLGTLIKSQVLYQLS